MSYGQLWADSGGVDCSVVGAYYLYPLNQAGISENTTLNTTATNYSITIGSTGVYSIDFDASMYLQSGGPSVILVAVYKNGVAAGNDLLSSGQLNTNEQQAGVGISGLRSLNSGDILQVYVSASDNASNIFFETAQFRVTSQS